MRPLKRFTPATFGALLFAFSYLLCMSLVVQGQGKQAVIILKAADNDSSGSSCEGGANMNYQIVSGIKLNSKDEIRLLSGLSGGQSIGVSRKTYETAPKSKLIDLFTFGWNRDGLLYAVSVSGQAPMLAVPENMKPQKNADPPLSSFYSAMLSGETREGKQKRQVNLPLRDISRIYFIPEGGVVNDALFNYAAQEKSISLWEAYLKKTNNYRISEANGFVRDALLTCAQIDLESFGRGQYRSLEKARQKTQRAQSVKDDDQSQRLSLSIGQAEEKVSNVRNQVEQLIRDSKWDEAIAAAEPIKIYLTTWPELDGMYKHTLKQSHEIHLFKGEEALRANQLEIARDNCALAWSRLPDSGTARTCVCESRNRITLRDSTSNRRGKHPKKAKELLEAQLADRDCTQDARVLADLKLANCEYAEELFGEARVLLGGAANNPAAVAVGPRRRGRPGVKSAGGPVRQASVANVKFISAQNKKDFREARAKLLISNQLCASESRQALLEAANRRLSDYCISEARKAIQRGDDGTAYVYSLAAQEYTPADPTVSSMIVEARDRFSQKTRVSIGVVFGDRSSSRYSQSVINQVSSDIESASAGAGLSQPVILNRRQAATAVDAIQSGKSLGGPTIIFFGDLLTADVRGGAVPRTVPSSFQYYNPQRKREDRAIDEVKDNHNNCKKQNGEAACSGFNEQLARLRAHRDSLQRYLTESYSYRETTYSVQGGLKLSFRSVNSISRGVRAAETLEASVGQRCVQREGLRDGSGNYMNDPPCNLAAEEAYISEMTGKITSDARQRAYSQLSDLPRSYFVHAQSAANRTQAVEDYLRFLFLAREKDGSDAQTAKTFLLAFDPELRTDGVLR